LREGEAAFSSGNYRTAADHYQRALQFDPKLYEAALFSGDAYFKLQEWNKAGEWFAKAIAINPERETAYRYWGDALMTEGKVIPARDKFIDAIISEPYNRLSYKGLGQWAQQYGVRITIPKLTIPVTSEKSSITIGSENPKAYWLAYGMARAFPSKPGDALQNEVAALRAAIQTAKELGYGNTGDADASMDTLIRLDKAGLLEAHVLFHRANKEIASSYRAYRQEKGDLLRRYWLEEVIRQ
jgi:tetratricopeptide (TPR) repeat protein